jgi:hypothetical protein
MPGSKHCNRSTYEHSSESLHFSEEKSGRSDSKFKLIIRRLYFGPEKKLNPETKYTVTALSTVSASLGLHDNDNTAILEINGDKMCVILFNGDKLKCSK